MFSLNLSVGDKRSLTHVVRAKAKLLTIRTLRCKTHRLVHFREINGVYCERHTKHISAEFYILKQAVHVAVTVLNKVIVCGCFKFHCGAVLRICCLNLSCLFSKTEFCCVRSSETNLKSEVIS
jgi:hypothetical protein